jgi:hypothetical protein
MRLVHQCAEANGIASRCVILGHRTQAARPFGHAFVLVDGVRGRRLDSVAP